MEDRRPAIVGVIIALQVLSWMALSMRLYVRRFIVRGVGWDDKILAIAMVPVLAQAVLQFLTTKYGLGLHITDVDLGGLTTMLYFTWWSGIAFNLSHLCIKLSYLAFYLRLMPDRRSRIIVYAGIAFVAAVGIAFTFLSIFMCTPVERGWDKSVPGTCIDSAGFLFSNTAFNMTADVLIFIMPIPALGNLQLPLRQRALLAGTFTCGSIILVASAVRLSTIFKLSMPETQDPTWELGPLILWAEVEVNVAVILSCTPAFKALMQTLFPSFMEGLVASSATRKSRAATQHNAYILQSIGKDDPITASNFQTVIQASGQDAKSLDSREHIVDGVAPMPGWPRMETTITVHSSKRGSMDETLEDMA